MSTTPVRPNAIADFEWWHNAVFGPKPFRNAIPHHVMRAYLNTLESAKRERSGLHNVTIIVTKRPIAGILNWDIMLETGTAIRVEGARWNNGSR